MKKFKKIIAIALTLAMMTTLAIGLTASADTANTGSITFNKTPGLNGETFNAYRVFDLVWDGVEGKDGAYVYTVNEKYRPFGVTETDIEKLGDGSLLARAFADRVWKAIAASETPVSAEENLINITFGTEETTKTVTGLPLGYYLIYSSGTNPNGNEPVVAAVSLNTTNANITVTPKVALPTLDKKVSLSATEGWGTEVDQRIGELVYFQLTAKVPSNLDEYEDYTYIIHDDLSDGLTYVNFISTNVTIAGVTTPNVAIATSGNVKLTEQKLEITVPFATLKGLTPNSDIVIVYSARLNDEAVIRDPGNPNTAWLEYSNDPYYDGEPGGGTGETTKVVVWVFTYDLAIYKHNNTEFDEDDEDLEVLKELLEEYLDDEIPGMPLALAEFQLTKKDDTTLISVVLVTLGDEETATVYRVATPDDTGTTTLVSPASGLIVVEGLEPGTYVVKETKPPAGYNLLTTTPEVVVNDDEISTVEVLNNSGELLPGVGGIGRTIFIVVGLSVMAGAVVLLVVRRKISKTAV